MSNSARLGVVLVAVVLAVAAFFVFRPDDTSRQQQSPQTESPGGPSQDESAEPRPADRPSAAAEPPPPAAVRIADGKPVGGVKTLSFDSGEEVRLVFRSDAPGEVHIHGYDRTVRLSPGRAARVSFPAELEGIFEVEEHDTGAELAKLRVEP